MQLRGRNLFHTRHSGRWARVPRGKVRLRRSKGYLLLELAITLTIVAVIGIYTRSVALQEIDDGVAAATGAYVLSAAAGLETYVLANTPALMNGQAVAKVAKPLQPTLAELQALSVNNSPMLPTTFPVLSPTRQGLQFDIQRVANTAGTVEIRATACLNAPLTWRGRYRDDMVAVAMQAMSGRGGRSVTADDGAAIRGALIAPDAGVLPNPVRVNNKTPVGILCSVNLLGNAFYSSFARQTDTRDLSFSGTVNATGTVDVTGTLKITDVAVGQTCVTAGAMAWVMNGTSYLPARCNGTNWVTTGGLPVAKAGDNCSQSGTLAMTPDGSTLICQRTAYVDILARMGSLVAMESLIVSNGSIVTKPKCSLGFTNQAIYLFPMTDVQSTQVVYRSASSPPSSVNWTISIVDESDLVVAGDALAMTYCIY